MMTRQSIEPFIREKIIRGLHKTQTPRINGTKSTPTAYSTQGPLKPWLILAKGFWDRLIQAAAYLGCESVRINALKRCPRLAEAMNDCCACFVFNYIPHLHGQEASVTVAGKWVLFTFTKWKMADRGSCRKRNVWSAPEEKQILLICSELEITGTSRWNHSTDRCRIFHRGFHISFPIFFDQLITLEPNANLDRRDNLKWKRQWKKQRFLRAKAGRCCEMQMQLPQNKAPKQTTSSLDWSGRKLSREPFIRAVRV